MGDLGSCRHKGGFYPCSLVILKQQNYHPYKLTQFFHLIPTRRATLGQHRSTPAAAERQKPALYFCSQSLLSAGQQINSSGKQDILPAEEISHQHLGPFVKLVVWWRNAGAGACIYGRTTLTFRFSPRRAAINGAVRSERAISFSFKHLFNIHHVIGEHFYVRKNTSTLPKWLKGNKE